MPKKSIQTGKKAKQPEKNTKNTVTALSAICGVMVSGVPIEESLDRIAGITAETMKAKACSVMFYDSHSRKFSLKASQGINISIQESVTPGNPGNSLCGLAIKEKKTMTSAEIGAYGTPVLPGTREFSDIKSMISSPIMINGEPVGVINTYNTEERIYTEDDKITMQAIADQSAAAIQIAKLKSEAEEAKDALKDRKLIDKAKGLLMQQRHMTEEQAYKAMRSKSMDTCKPMKEVAEAIILASEMKL